MLIELTTGVKDLQNEIQSAMNEDQDLIKAKIESELKLKQYRRILNDKSVLYD